MGSVERRVIDRLIRAPSNAGDQRGVFVHTWPSGHWHPRWRAQCGEAKHKLAFVFILIERVFVVL